MEFGLGSRVTCDDGEAGRLVGLIADPVARSLSHIAVEPTGPSGRARMAPVGLVTRAARAAVELGCALEGFRGLPPVRDIHLVPGVAGYDPWADLSVPEHATEVRRVPVVVDRVPAGEVELRRRERVWGSDGAIGRVEGVVADLAGRITHLLLEEGRPWRRREVAIPVDRLSRIDAGGVHVGLSRREVGDLPGPGRDGRRPGRGAP